MINFPKYEESIFNNEKIGAFYFSKECVKFKNPSYYRGKAWMDNFETAANEGRHRIEAMTMELK